MKTRCIGKGSFERKTHTGDAKKSKYLNSPNNAQVVDTEKKDIALEFLGKINISQWRGRRENKGETVVQINNYVYKYSKTCYKHL